VSWRNAWIAVLGPALWWNRRGESARPLRR
jgi:hypothetical protein